MKQHQIDLLPDSIRLRCQAGVRTGQTVSAFVAVIVLLVVMLTYGRLELDQAETELVATRTQADLVLEMERRASSLQQSHEQAAEYVELYRKVAPPLEVSDVVATIINELPASVALDRIEIDAGARRRVRTARSRGSAEEDEARPRILNCEIAGFARSDEQVAEIVDRLSDRPPFQRVSLDFSRTRLVREQAAREFRLSCRVDLEAAYEIERRETAVASAEEGP